MSINLPLHRNVLLFIFALFICAVFFTGKNAQAKEGGTTTPSKSCTLPASHTRPVPDGSELHVTGDLLTGSTVKVTFDLKGYTIPTGSYLSVNVRPLGEAEEKDLTVKAGYPDTLVVFHKAGLHRARFILTEISKPSCGGVDARPLLEKILEFQITK